ncbi:hypothetical protein M3Y94_00944300 [Aphelenchoides besseyi]|nr:hypothetical protein M3Y94_00944300 [Aphelenchoides besseyi]KAI6224869.1 hypothetical protein M3Y95_00798300 [Aphelenchoides besseyi]
MSDDRTSSFVGMENVALRNPKSAINRVKQMENNSSPGPAMLQSTPANGSVTKRLHVLFSPIGLPVVQSPISRPKIAETAEPEVVKVQRVEPVPVKSKHVEPKFVEPIPVDPKPSTAKQTTDNHTPDLEPLAAIDNKITKRRRGGASASQKPDPISSLQVNPAPSTSTNTEVNGNVMASGRPRRKAAPKNLKEPDLIHKMRRLK